jgi:hypothetical protein
MKTTKLTDERCVNKIKAYVDNASICQIWDMVIERLFRKLEFGRKAKSRDPK